MANVYQGAIAHDGPHPLQGLGAWVAHRLGAFVERRRHATEMAALAAFSDRDLWDLGLSRSDLMSIDRGTFRRD